MFTETQNQNLIASRHRTERERKGFDIVLHKIPSHSQLQRRLSPECYDFKIITFLQTGQGTSTSENNKAADWKGRWNDQGNQREQNDKGSPLKYAHFRYKKCHQSLLFMTFHVLYFVFCADIVIHGTSVNKQEQKEGLLLLKDMKTKYKMVHERTMEEAARIECDRNTEQHSVEPVQN